LTNNGTQAVSDWTVQIAFPHAVNISNAWSIDLQSSSGTSITGSDVGYNGTLQPGQSVTFGMQGAPGGVGTPECSAE
jgi:cellulase/cellobiase CelA1